MELGKRLGAISKEARERKARERQQQQRESETSPYLVFRLAVGIAAVVVAGYYYFRNNDTKEVTKEGQKEERLSNKIPRLERL